MLIGGIGVIWTLLNLNGSTRLQNGEHAVMQVCFDTLPAIYFGKIILVDCPISLSSAES